MAAAARFERFFYFGTVDLPKFDCCTITRSWLVIAKAVPVASVVRRSARGTALAKLA